MANGPLIYQDQSPFALQLNVVEGKLDITQFNTVKTGSILLPHLEVEARIIGASHMITFILGNFYLYEVFACTDVQASGKRAYCGPLRDVAGKVQLDFPRMAGYTFEASIEPLRDARRDLSALEKAVQRCADLDGYCGLEFAFPNPGNMEQDPKTIILVHYNDRANLVNVQTAHVYPPEHVVITRTCLEVFKDPGELLTLLRKELS